MYDTWRLQSIKKRSEYCLATSRTEFEDFFEYLEFIVFVTYAKVCSFEIWKEHMYKDGYNRKSTKADLKEIKLSKFIVVYTLLQ